MFRKGVCVRSPFGLGHASHFNPGVYDRHFAGVIDNAVYQLGPGKHRLVAAKAHEAECHFVARPPLVGPSADLLGEIAGVSIIVRDSARKDRLELTGMRWRAAGAQAMLDLRAVYLNDDWDAFQQYRVKQERRRLHPYLRIVRQHWRAAA